jgi:hypothetical protein
MPPVESIPKGGMLMTSEVLSYAIMYLADSLFLAWKR